MKAPLVCFLLLVVSFAMATEWDTDGIILQAKGQVEQQNPEPPTGDTSGKKQQGGTGPPSYGQCPPTITIVPQDYYCQLSGPCPGDEKCCQIGRMTKCLLPKGVHHRYCPRPQDQPVYNKLCAGDYQCGWHEKCCSTEGHKKCVVAVAGVAGVCPKKRLPRGPTSMEHRCLNDLECDSGKKCCLEEHGLNCVYPEGLHRNRNRNRNQNQNQNQDQTDICQLPEETGLCRGYIPRWFYNKQTGRCERSFYGDCTGNSNNFKTLQECEHRCVLPDVNKQGTCPAVVQSEDAPCGRFCSDDASCPSIQRCCDTSCGKKCTIPQENRPGYCPVLLLPPSRGNVCFQNCTKDRDCNHNIVNLPWKKCCNFAGRKICVDAVEEHPGVCPRRIKLPTLVPCNSTCSDDRDCNLTEKCCYTGCGKGCLPSVRSDQCQLPLQQDSCKKKLQRYHYDGDKKKCVLFMGCGDNRKNFETRELCEKACGKISKEVCKLPADPGRCLAYSEQYYYNWNTKKCETFVYGRCNGNGNRFSTKLECQMVCGEFVQQQQQQQQPKE